MNCINQDNRHGGNMLRLKWNGSKQAYQEHLEACSKHVSKRRYRKKQKVKHPRIPYNEYLHTKWWKSKRKQKLKSTNGLCERCGKIATTVHHKHYNSLWCEKNMDLESLCGLCHEGEHEGIIQAKKHMDSISRQNLSKGS